MAHFYKVGRVRGNKNYFNFGLILFSGVLYILRNPRWQAINLFSMFCFIKSTIVTRGGTIITTLLTVFPEIYSNWATSHENVSSRIFNQVRFKPACWATETSWNLETLDRASIHIILSKQWKTKVLIRLHRCTGWSALLLFTYGIRHIFAWPGPIIKTTDQLWARAWQTPQNHVWPAKTQISLHIWKVCWESLLTSWRNILRNIYTCHWLPLDEPFWTNWLHTPINVKWSCDVVDKWCHGSTNILSDQCNVPSQVMVTVV